MNDNILTKDENLKIFKRIRFRTDRYPRYKVFDYNPDGEYTLQSDLIHLDEGEHPLFENRTSYNSSYTLLTTKRLYSQFKIDPKLSPEDNIHIFKIPIDEIKYRKSLSEIIDEREKRLNNIEVVTKFIGVRTEQEVIICYLSSGVSELLFHEVLTQLIAINHSKKRKEKEQNK